MNSHCAIGDEWLLSQHLLGWPSFRPRLYTILVRKESGFLDGPKLNLVNSLYRQPSTCSRDLFCAPACRRSSCVGTSPFCVLLGHRPFLLLVTGYGCSGGSGSTPGIFGREVQEEPTHQICGSPVRRVHCSDHFYNNSYVIQNLLLKPYALSR